MSDHHDQMAVLITLKFVNATKKLSLLLRVIFELQMGIKVKLNFKQVVKVQMRQLTSHLGDSGINRRPTSCNKHGATPTREKLAFMHTKVYIQGSSMSIFLSRYF
jgi:hypothetical protein